MKTAGIVSLYTREQFELVHSRLAEGGLVTYWLPVRQLEPAETRRVIRGFCEVFHDCSLWSAFGSEWMLAGGRGTRRRPTEEEFAEPWLTPRVARDLDRCGLESPESLGTLFIGDAPFLRRLTRDDSALEDDRPWSPFLPTESKESLRYYQDLADVARARERFAASPLIGELWPEAIRARTLGDFDRQAAFSRFSWAYHRQGATRLVDAMNLLASRGNRVAVLWSLGSSLREQEIAGAALRAGDRSPLVFLHLGVGALADRDYVAAGRLFLAGQLLSAPGSSELERLAQLRIFALLMSGERAQAAVLLPGPNQPISAAHEPDWVWLASELRQAKKSR